MPKTEKTLRYSSMSKTFKLVLQEEGLGKRGIYKGLSGTFLREGSYSGMRLGFYEPIKRALGETDKSNSSLYIKFMAGGISGLIGSGIANPFDLVKTRMQSQLPGQNKNILWHAKYIYKEAGGLQGFFKGSSATMLRATILNTVCLGTYDSSKHALIDSGHFEEGVKVQFLASTLSGFFVSLSSSPADNIKTNLMTQRFDIPASHDNPRYSGLFDCAKQMYRREGASSFYRGFFPQWARFAPYLTIQFLVWETLRSKLGFGNL